MPGYGNYFHFKKQFSNSLAAISLVAYVLGIQCSVAPGAADAVRAGHPGNLLFQKSSGLVSHLNLAPGILN
jgi:phosphatidylinositol kinase/protein kinase (PI-3  family)